MLITQAYSMTIKIHVKIKRKNRYRHAGTDINHLVALKESLKYTVIRFATLGQNALIERCFYCYL